MKSIIINRFVFFFNNMKISTRLGLGFGIILLIVITAVIITSIFHKTLRVNTILVRDNSIPSTLLVNDMTYQTMDVMRLMFYSSTTQRSEGFKMADRVAVDFKKNLAVLKQNYLQSSNTDAYKEAELLEHAFDQYYELGRDMAFVYFTEGVEEGNSYVADFEKASQNLREKMSRLQDYEKDMTRKGIRVISASVARVETVMYAMNGITILLSIIIAFLITRSITKPLNRAVVFANTIAEGDLTHRLEIVSSNELCQMNHALNVMADGLEAKAKVAEEIASGNLQVNVEMASVKDSLGKTLKTMVNGLNVMVHELQEAKIGAESANVSKSMFLANMSHEIRTPMNAILGFSTLLHDHVQTNEAKEYLSAITSSGNTLLSLINDILDLSKIEAGKMDLEYTTVNPHSIFSEMKNIFSKKIQEKNLEFKMEIDPELPVGLILDEIRIRQVLFNLVGNAIKFTENGSVKLQVMKSYFRNDRSSLNLTFSVEDSGIGIPKDQYEVIFNSFQQQTNQSHSQFGGTGLGLAISKRLVEIMNGYISLDSQVGVGSRFSVTLMDVMVASIHGDDKTKIKKRGPDVEFEQASLLIVDDVDVNRSLLKIFLKNYNFELYEAANGEEAISMTRHLRPNIILMDIKMPVMDGYEATRILKSDDDTKAIPIIAVTASGMKMNEKMVKDAGCNSFLLKPVRKEKLIEEMMKFLPHTVNKVEENVEDHNLHEISESIKNNIISIPPETRKKIPELMLILQSDFEIKYQNIQDSFFMHEIKEFAEEITDIGSKFKIDILTGWGENLLNYSEIFDVEKITVNLKEWPGLLQQISSLQEASNEN